MAELTIVYWRDIPAQVIVRAARRSAKRALPDRFQEAIDRAAMSAKLHGSDAYLSAWRRAPAGPCGDDLEAEAEGAAQRLDQAYPDERLRALVAAGGAEPSAQG